MKNKPTKELKKYLTKEGFPHLAEILEPTKESELKKAEEALGKEHNLNQISFYEGYIKGLKFEPTKECKHEELLGADYTEDCSVKLFGYRDKKGVTHITREEVSSPKIDSLLKEADKEFDEKFYCPFLIEDTDKRKEMIDMIKKAEKYARGGTKLLTTSEQVKDFLHSQIELAYNKGLEEKLFIGQIEVAKEVIQREREQTLKQIEDWAKEKKQLTDTKTTYQYAISYDDLKKFLSKL
jgi:histidinol phosphatase-like enzyme